MVTAGSAVGMAATANATALRNSSWSWTLRYSPRTIEIASAMPAMTRIWLVRRSSCLVSGVFSTAVAWSMPLMWPTSVAIPVVVTRIVPAPRVTWQFMNAMSTRSPSAASAATASTCLGVGTLSPVRADSSISRVAAVRMRASAGTRSPASMFTMSPGTSSSIGTSASSPSRRTLALTTIMLWRADALASALPSWFIAIQALNRVSTMRKTPVKNWPGRKRQTMPATRSTICIGSAYWRVNGCSCEAFLASSKAFGPTLARRASASAVVRPRSTSTPCWRSASSVESACQAVPSLVAVPAAAVGVGVVACGHPFFPFFAFLAVLRAASSAPGSAATRRAPAPRVRPSSPGAPRAHRSRPSGSAGRSGSACGRGHRPQRPGRMACRRQG